MAAAGVVLSADSVIDASSRVGIDGTVEIQVDQSYLTGDLAPLPQEFLDAAAMVRASCAARGPGMGGSFVVHTQVGIPETPDGLLASPLRVVSRDAVSALD